MQIAITKDRSLSRRGRGEERPKEKSTFALKTIPITHIASIMDTVIRTSAIVLARYDLSLAVFDHNCILKPTHFFSGRSPFVVLLLRCRENMFQTGGFFFFRDKSHLTDLERDPFVTSVCYEERIS